MDEARKAQEQKKQVGWRPGGRVRFRDGRTPRIQADAYTVVRVDPVADKVQVRHLRPRGHAYAYLFWYDSNDLEVEDDGATTADPA